MADTSPIVANDWVIDPIVGMPAMLPPVEGQPLMLAPQAVSFRSRRSAENQAAKINHLLLVDGLTLAVGAKGAKGEWPLVWVAKPIGDQ